MQIDENKIDNILLSKMSIAKHAIQSAVINELTYNKEFFDALFSRIQADYSKQLTPADKAAIVYCHYLYGDSNMDHYLPNAVIISYINHRVVDVNAQNMLCYYIRHKENT